MFLSSAKSDPIVGIKIFVKEKATSYRIIQIIFISNKIKVTYSMLDYEIYVCVYDTLSGILKYLLIKLYIRNCPSC